MASAVNYGAANSKSGEIKWKKWAVAYALIEHPDQASNWLVTQSRNDFGAIEYDFIHSERLERESFRETITREVAWVLNLDPKKEIVVSKMPQLNFERIGLLDVDRDPTESRSVSLDSFKNENEEQIHYVIEFYKVLPYCKDFADRISALDPIKWISTKALFDTNKQSKVSPRLRELLSLTQVIQPWN